MAGSIPHRSVAAALLAVWGAVVLVALPLTMKTHAGSWILATSMAIGGFIGGLITAATVRLGPASAAVAAAIAVLLLTSSKGSDAVTWQIAVFAATAAATTAAGAHAGARLTWRARVPMAGLIGYGVLMVVGDVTTRLHHAGLIAQSFSLTIYGGTFLGGALAAALVPELRARDAALGAGGTMLVLATAIGVATGASDTVMVAFAIFIPICAVLAAAGFALARNVFGLGRPSSEPATLPTARAVDRD